MGNMSSVMQFKDQPSSYTDVVSTARPTDPDLFIKQQLYEEYVEAKKKDFNGTYEEYLTYRDFS